MLGAMVIAVNDGLSFFAAKCTQVLHFRSWAMHPITHGPDFAIKIMRIPLSSGESRLVIIGAGFWDNKLYAVWTEGK